MQNGVFDEYAIRDEYGNTDNMLPQSVMMSFNIVPYQWASVIASVYEQWNQLNAQHSNLKDFDSHLRRTLAIWANNGKLRKLIDSNTTGKNRKIDEYGGEI